MRRVTTIQITLPTKANTKLNYNWTKRREGKKHKSSEIMLKNYKLLEIKNLGTKAKTRSNKTSTVGLQR
jgi:hypothetical protein